MEGMTGLTGTGLEAGALPLTDFGPSTPTDVGALSVPGFDLGPEAGGVLAGPYTQEGTNTPYFDVPKPGTGLVSTQPHIGGIPLDIIKALPALAGGGMQLVNMFRSSPTEKLISSGQQQMRGLSKAAGSAGKNQLNQYIKGNLSEAQQAAVERFKQTQRAYWNQYFAKAGIPVSSAMAEIEGKIQQDAQVYANQLLQQNFQNSMASMGLAQNSLATQGQQNAYFNAQTAQASAAAADAIAKMAGVLFPGNTSNVY